MNREIKFRATKQVIGGFAYGHYTQGSDGFHYITKPDGEIHEVNPDTVCQFTGLQDKNGKDIYEGDIVEAIASGKYKEYTTISDVIYSATDCGQWQIRSSSEYDFGLNVLWGGWDSIEVIGNIFENPELLQK